MALNKVSLSMTCDDSAQGYAIVCYENEVDAKRAIKELDKSELLGTQIRVSFCPRVITLKDIQVGWAFVNTGREFNRTRDYMS